MLKSIDIRGYRKFEQIKINDFSRINIFLGGNNLGKTSILESIFGYACGENILPLIDHSIMRRNNIISIYDFMERIIGAFNDTNGEKFRFSFKGLVDNREIKITHEITPSPLFSSLLPNVNVKLAEMAIDTVTSNQNINNNIIGKWEIYYNDEMKKSALLTYPNMDIIELSGQHLITAKFNDILTHRNQQENTVIYSHLKRERIIKEFKDELSKTFGEIKEIDSIPYPDGSSSPVSIMMGNDKYIPLYNFGDGFQRWFNILGSMVYNKNSIHCIEEIDVTFHPEAQKELGKNLIYYAEKFNNQLFMTSHSIEFIDNFLEGLSEDQLNNVRIITLRKSKDTSKLNYRVISGKEALDRRENYEMELR